jgi:SAM-dependent methyltransferase
VDIDRPSAARMYDYYLGGSHNFAVDRQAAEQVVEAIPNVRQIAVANRAFLRNAVLHLLDLGVRQFLDVGSGIPTVGNVHEVAQAVDLQARVVYVDIDPVAVIHARHLLSGNDGANAIAADLRHPEAILAHRSLRETLDLTRPVGLLLVSVLHFLPDPDAYPADACLRRALPPGSGLVVSHAAAEGLARGSSDAAAAVYQRSTAPGGAMRIPVVLVTRNGDSLTLLVAVGRPGV